MRLSPQKTHRFWKLAFKRLRKYFFRDRWVIPPRAGTILQYRMRQVTFNCKCYPFVVFPAFVFETAVTQSPQQPSPVQGRVKRWKCPRENESVKCGESLKSLRSSCISVRVWFSSCCLFFFPPHSSPQSGLCSQALNAFGKSAGINLHSIRTVSSLTPFFFFFLLLQSSRVKYLSPKRCCCWASP